MYNRHITKTAFLPRAYTLQEQKVGKFNITSLYTAVLANSLTFGIFPLHHILHECFCSYERKFSIHTLINVSIWMRMSFSFTYNKFYFRKPPCISTLWESSKLGVTTTTHSIGTNPICIVHSCFKRLHPRRDVPCHPPHNTTIQLRRSMRWLLTHYACRVHCN